MLCALIAPGVRHLVGAGPPGHAHGPHANKDTVATSARPLPGSGWSIRRACPGASERAHSRNRSPRSSGCRRLADRCGRPRSSNASASLEGVRRGLAPDVPELPHLSLGPADRRRLRLGGANPSRPCRSTAFSGLALAKNWASRSAKWAEPTRKSGSPAPIQIGPSSPSKKIMSMPMAGSDKADITRAVSSSTATPEAESSAPGIGASAFLASR